MTTLSRTSHLKLTKIDQLVRGDHSLLCAEDECYCLGEYTARKGYSFSDMNNLVLNLKKKPTASQAELRHKERAIASVADALRESLAVGANLKYLKHATLVPVPPSAARSSPLYDDRIVRILSRMGSGLNLDIRPLVRQINTLTPSHECVCRPTISELVDNYDISEECAVPTPRSFLIFDDVLTAGTHFKAMQYVLAKRFGAIPTVGIFVARRVPDSEFV